MKPSPLPFIGHASARSIALTLTLAVGLPFAAFAQDKTPAPPATPKPEEPTKKPDPSAFLLEAGIPPITFPKTSITTQDFNRQRLECYKRTLLPAMNRELDGALDIPAKMAIAEKLLGWWVGSGPAANLSLPAAEALAKEITDLVAPSAIAPVFQALAGQFMASINREAEGVERCRVTLERLDPATAPGIAGLNALVVLIRAGAVDLEAEGFSAKVSKFLDPAISPAQCSEADAACLVAALTEPNFSQLLDPFADKLIETFRASKLPDWARLTLVGQCERQIAWTARGGGFANSVSETGWRGFAKHMEKARDAYTEAWKLRPDRPEAAVDMIGVAMSGHAAKGESMRFWFNRATAAQCDHAVAYQNVLWGLRPRWGGSTQKMAAFGLACGLGHQPGSRVGEQFMVALQDVASETPQWAKFLRDPRLAGPLVETGQKLAAEATTDLARREQNAMLAFEAWLTGQSKVAAETLAKVGDFADPKTALPAKCAEALPQFGVNAFEFVHDCRLRGGPWATAYTKIAELRTARKLSEASSQLDELRKDPAAAKDFILSCLAATNAFETKMDKGEWTKFPVLPGSWNSTTPLKYEPPDIKIVDEGSNFMLFRGTLGNRYEVRGEIILPSDRAHFFTGFIFGAKSAGSGATATFVVSSGDGKTPVLAYTTPTDRSPNRITLKEPWNFPEEKTPLAFRLRREEDRISLWFADRLILDRQSMTGELPGGDFSFGTIMSGGTAETPLIFRNLEAKRLGVEL